jgi:glycerol transport system ATP-binding protein
VSQSHGVHPFQVGSQARLYLDMDHAFFFDASERLVQGAG